MKNSVHKGTIQGEDVLTQFWRHACVIQEDKWNVTIDRWEGQDNVIQVDKGGGTMHLLSRVNEFSEGEDNIKG